MIFLLLVVSFIQKLLCAPPDNRCYTSYLSNYLDGECEYGRIPQCKYDSVKKVCEVIPNTSCYTNISFTSSSCQSGCRKVANADETERNTICNYFGVALSGLDQTCCIPLHNNESLAYDQRCTYNSNGISTYGDIHCLVLQSFYGGKLDCHLNGGCKTTLGPADIYVDGACLPNSNEPDLIKACKDGEIEGCVYEKGSCKHKKSPKEIIDGGYYKIVNLSSTGECPSQDQIKVPRGSNSDEVNNTLYRQNICSYYGLSAVNETTTCCIPKLTEKSHLRNVTCDYFTGIDACDHVSPTTQKLCKFVNNECVPESGKIAPPDIPDRDGKAALFDQDFKFLCDLEHAGTGGTTYYNTLKEDSYGKCVYKSYKMDDTCGVAVLRSGHCTPYYCGYTTNLFWCDIFLNDTEKKKAVETGGCCAPPVPAVTILDFWFNVVGQAECNAYNKLAKSATGFDNVFTYNTTTLQCLPSNVRFSSDPELPSIYDDDHYYCNKDGATESNCDTDKPGCFWNATQEEAKFYPHVPIGHCHVDNECIFDFHQTGLCNYGNCYLKTIKNYDHPICVGNHATGKSVFAKNGLLKLNSSDNVTVDGECVDKGNDGKPHYFLSCDDECGVGINTNLIYKSCPSDCPLRKGNNKKETTAICNEFGVKLKGSDDACCVPRLSNNNYEYGCHTADGDSSKCHLLKGVFGIDCAYNTATKKCESCSKYNSNEEGCVSIGCGYRSGTCSKCESTIGYDDGSRHDIAESCITDRSGCCFDYKDFSGYGCKGYNDSTRTKSAVCDLDLEKYQESHPKDECSFDYLGGTYGTSSIQCLDKPKCCYSGSKVTENGMNYNGRCVLKKGVGKYICDSPTDGTDLLTSFTNCFIPYQTYSESDSKSACDDDRCCLVDVAAYLKKYKLHDPAFFNVNGKYVATNITKKMCIPNFGGFKDVCDNKKPPTYDQFPYCNNYGRTDCELLSIFGCKYYNTTIGDCFHLNDAELEGKDKYPKMIEKASAVTSQIHRWGVALVILLVVIAL